MTAMIEAKAVTYRRGGRNLVEGIDLAVPAGSFTIVVGPNGAGKSTLLRLLCGELAPTFGEIAINGRALRALPAWQLAHCRAVMPQSSDLALPFTVFAVARLGVEGLGQGLSRASRDCIAVDALGEADLSHLADRDYQTLSGGERQRVHFARALAQLRAGRTREPHQILFLDEPIASLDLRHQLALLQHARRLARDGLAVIAVLHDLPMAAAFGDAVILMNNGRLIAAGPPDDVLTPERLATVFGVRFASRHLPVQPWSLVPDVHAGTTHSLTHSARQQAR